MPENRRLENRSELDVSTMGKTEQAVRQYILEQEVTDRPLDQLKLERQSPHLGAMDLFQETTLSGSPFKPSALPEVICLPGFHWAGTGKPSCTRIVQWPFREQLKAVNVGEEGVQAVP